MTLQHWITQVLQESLQPTELTVTDESEQHHGHAGWREGGETHFRLYIVSEAFSGKSRVERHRLVNDDPERRLRPGAARPGDPGQGAGGVTKGFRRRAGYGVMAGLVPAIPIMKSAALHLIEITGTRPVMTWGVPHLIRSSTLT